MLGVCDKLENVEANKKNYLDEVKMFEAIFTHMTWVPSTLKEYEEGVLEASNLTKEGFQLNAKVGVLYF